MPQAKYDELQVEDAPNPRRNYRKIGIIAGAIAIGCLVVILLAIYVPNSGKGNSNDVPYYSFANDSFIEAGPAAGIPCIAGTSKPSGCVQRFFSCGTTKDLNGVKAVIGPAHDTACKQTRVYVNELYVVQFYNKDRQCLEIKMEMGECWGKHPTNGNVYSCQGKCGAGCGNINCGAWARDCLRHDACSWYYTATDGAKDPHCGESYNLAADDFWGNCDCNASGGKDKELVNMCPK